MFYFFTIVVIIVIIILFLPVISTDDDIRCNANNIINNKLVGDKLDDNVLKVIRKINKIKDKNADDYNNLGMLYSCHLKNNARAYDNYVRVLKLIRQGKVKENNAVNMMYKMEDIISEYKGSPRLKSIIKDTQNLVHKKNIKKTLKSKIPKKKIIKKIEDKKIWKSDPQNVHDSKMLYDIKSQFQYIKEQNDIIRQPYSTFDNICTIILNYPEFEGKNINKITKVLERIRNGSSSNVLGLNIEEKAFFMEIWRRIQSLINKKNRKELEKYFILSIQDCIEGDNDYIVCSSGRNARLFSCLAFLDKESKNKGIGILKTKESIRNEILEECAKIVKKYTDCGQTKNKMGIPKYVIEHYNEGRVTTKVKELEENIRKEILNLKEQFINRGFDDIYIDQILNECILFI